MQPDPTLKREVFLLRYHEDFEYREALNAQYAQVLTDLTCDLYDEVADERAFQLAKFGNEILDPFVAIAVIDEEKGEASKAALENDWANHRAELLQTAVSALKAVQNIDRMLLNKAIGLPPEPVETLEQLFSSEDEIPVLMNRAQFYKKYEGPLRLDDRGGSITDSNGNYVAPKALLEYLQWVEEEQDGLVKAYCNIANLLARFIET